MKILKQRCRHEWIIKDYDEEISETYHRCKKCKATKSVTNESTFYFYPFTLAVTGKSFSFWRNNK